MGLKQKAIIFFTAVYSSQCVVCWHGWLGWGCFFGFSMSIFTHFIVTYGVVNLASEQKIVKNAFWLSIAIDGLSNLIFYPTS